MKRNPRKLKWTKAFRTTRKKEMTMDPTINFEQKRNRPERYNRERMEVTIKAMKRISEIRNLREIQFYNHRMKDRKRLENLRNLKELESNLPLIEAPKELLKNRTMLLEMPTMDVQKTKTF
jgi:large subunit ribosomal protein L24e